MTTPDIAELTFERDHLRSDLAAALAERNDLAAEVERLRAALAASCDEERDQLFEAGPGGGCSRAIAAEQELGRLRAQAAPAPQARSKPDQEITPAQCIPSEAAPSLADALERCAAIFGEIGFKSHEAETRAALAAYRAAPSLTVGERADDAHGLVRVRIDTTPDADGWCFCTPMNHPDDVAKGRKDSLYNSSAQFFGQVLAQPTAQAEPVAWPSGIDIADEIDELLPTSMGYSTRAKVEQWWRDLVARKLRQLAQVEPVRMTGTMPVRINGLEFSAPWELLTQPVFGYHFEPIAEPAAVVGSGYQLLWTGGEDFAAHAKKHGITVGTLLYTGPQSNPPAQGVVDERAE